jgi:hypothetical protein
VHGHCPSIGQDATSVALVVPGENATLTAMDAKFGSEIGRQALDILGRAIADVYDTSLGQVEVMATQAQQGHGRQALASMTPEQIEAIRAAAPDIVETVLFELLAHLDWQETTRGPVRISVQVGNEVVENPATCSNELPGELVVDGGWLERFATKPTPPRERA